MVDEKRALDVQVAGDHYKTMGIQPIEFGMANQLNMCQALALRYITRNKGGFLKRIEEREKAIHCIQLEIDFIKADMALPTEERVALRRALIAKLESEIKEIENEPSN